ncbi:hypothetical protein [Denitratimonas sp. CY0512]|uniref:hypothetical protein n=1 Tax=Denitratimonas sp. CY0512 TaxID=3131940 RepID=UPI0030A49F0E
MNDTDAIQGAMVALSTTTAIPRERKKYQTPMLMQSNLSKVVAGAGGSQFDTDFSAATMVG